MLVTKFVLPGVSAVIAELATYPIDAVKIRMQLASLGSAAASPSSHAALPPASRLGPLSVAAAVLRTEGPRGLYAGVRPAIWRQIPYSGVRISAYEALRKRLDASSAAGSGAGESAAAKMVIGATAGGLGQLVAVPFDLLKAGSRWVPAAPLAPTPPAAAAGRGAATSRGQGAERAFPRGRRRCGCRPTPAQSPPATWRRPATPASPTRCER